MKCETSFQIFFLKEHRKDSLKNIVFPWESVFTAIAKILHGHRTAQKAHCAVRMASLSNHTAQIVILSTKLYAQWSSYGYEGVALIVSAAC